jgi:ElaB/YqjD/DUF883 family membrane-anchored ribosome-binding protein
MMFQPRPTAFDTRLSAIADHLRAIEKELGSLGKKAGSRASANASAAGNQIADALGPVLSDIVDRFWRGQRTAVDEAVSLGNEAVRVGTRVGNDALGRLTTQARHRPLVTVAVAVGIGIMIGLASRRNWD